MKDNPILRVASKILFAPTIVYGLYVQFHGDYGPGGGFQAGVIVAAAFVLHGLIFGIASTKKVAPPTIVHTLMALGVLVYGGVGVVSMMLGGLYLDYNVLADKAATGQHIGIILVEFGVGLTVASTVLALFYTFAGFDETRQKKMESPNV
ncbi:MAG: Na(+)/H(+) antiporter subunit B [Proteobacteria bacterium]|nr:Na(+)/H(+) antiporter subunit B [Pseudomonadota bacterium]